MAALADITRRLVLKGALAGTATGISGAVIAAELAGAPGLDTPEDRAAYHLEGLRAALSDGHPEFEFAGVLKWDKRAAFVMGDPRRPQKL